MPSLIHGCDYISEACPVEGSIYGYFPSMGGNAFFCAMFFLLAPIQYFLGFRSKTWFYSIMVGTGCLTEGIGYVGRLLLHNNPYDSNGFEVQICCLIMAPAWLAAGVYVTLKHIILATGPQYSWLQAKWYTWLFVTCDLISLILQAVGGATAATAGTNNTQLNTGSNTMLAGIVFQVATSLVFGISAAHFFSTLRKNKAGLSTEASQLLRETKFRLFLLGVSVAYVAILTRCAYRVAEMANGWGNPIMQSEAEFMVLDGA